MTYHSLDEWLGEIENFATRDERLFEEFGSYTPSVREWLETAWRLGSEAQRWAAECNKDMGEAAKPLIRELLTNHGVPSAAFIDDHVANAIAQRNILAECLVNLRSGASQERAAAIDAAIAKAYPSGVELRALGDPLAKHLRSLVDAGTTEGRE